MTGFLSVGVLVTVLVLNASPVGAASQRAQAAQAPVTIRVSTWDTGNAGLKPYQVGIKAFEAANPGIKMVMFLFCAAALHPGHRDDGV
jgi:ABC-type glycerol-3-phosphate transport system substrate-binding protein